MLVRHLIIFARYPRFGVGKSRLAAGAGWGTALRFQRVMLATLLQRLGNDPRWSTWLAVTPDRSGPWPAHIGVRGQGNGDLGQRITNVVKQMNPGPVVIVGTDSPSIRADHVWSAFTALGKCDAVFGPASDGGYWLVGLRRRPHFINPFHSVRWSTEHALKDTLANLHGYSVALLERMDDVDGVEELERMRNWDVRHAPRHS